MPQTLEAVLHSYTGVKTFPAIFIGKHYIGGLDQLKEMDQNGALDSEICACASSFVKVKE